MVPRPEVAFPVLLVHADWGSDPRKRWMCVAQLDGGRTRVRAPEPVGGLEDFWARVLDRASGAAVVVGFDFPIGLPAAYALRAGVTDFPGLLPRLGRGRWADFYTLAEAPDEVRLERPFYPRRPGGTSQRHLLAGLGLASMERLLRRCEAPTAARGAAAPVFWTLGSKQVGRAAIIGWRDLLAPGLEDPALDLQLWPFHGRLPGLLEPGRIVVAETYPAEACVQVGLAPPGRGWSKRRAEDRRRHRGVLEGWARRRSVLLTDRLRRAVREGFGADARGEDPFDAFLGLLSMVEVVRGLRGDGVPDDASVARVEGWILGQGGSG